MKKKILGLLIISITLMMFVFIGSCGVTNNSSDGQIDFLNGATANGTFN